MVVIQVDSCQDLRGYIEESHGEGLEVDFRLVLSDLFHVMNNFVNTIFDLC